MNRSEASSAFDVKRILHLAGVAALGGFLFGYDTSVVNGAVDSMQDAWSLSPGLTGFVVSSALLACVVGAFVGGRIADARGRIAVMVGAAVLFVVSAVGCGFATGPVSMIGWRAVGGLAVGAASVIAPAYIAEISPARVRGRLGSLQQLAIVVGIFVALLVNYLLADLAGGASQDLWFGLPAWRWMFMAEALPALVYGALALTIPESPRYLVARGRVDEAREVLGRIIGDGVDERISEIKRTVRQDERSSLADLRAKKGLLLPIVWIGIVLSVFQQFVGINVIFYYSSTLWQSVGFAEAAAMLHSVITSITNIVVTLVAIALIDRIGRRRLLITGSTGMVVSLGLLTWVFSQAPVVEGQPQLTETGGLVALIAANGFVVFFGMSWGPGVWVLLGEMFNNRIRGTALGLAAGAQWLANFAVSTTFPAMADFGLWFAYGSYTLAAALSLLFVVKFVPETKDRELEDMD